MFSLNKLSLKADLSIDKKNVLEVSTEGKEILIEIKDPMIAIDLGLLYLLKCEGNTRKRLKDKGFKIRVKYKVFDFEL